MSTTARRSRTANRSGVLYRYDEGIRRLSRRDPVELVNAVEPTEDRTLPREPDLDAAFAHEPPRLPIPASGEPYDDCGERQPLLYCDRCGKPHRVARRCRRSTCPECWESWAIKRGVDVAAKLEARRAYEESKRGGWDGYKFHHVVASPPPGIEFRRDGLDGAFEAVKMLMVEVGLYEGAAIYHPWRIKKEHRGDVLGHSSGHGDMTWRHILSAVERDGFEAVSENYLVYAPHFHVVGLSKFVTGGELTEHLEDRSGWVVHRIADAAGASVRDLEGLCSVVGYSLSHAGLTASGRGKDAAYRYFGEVANFEPTENVHARTYAAMASVAETILGVEPRGNRCGEEVHVPAVDADHIERVREHADDVGSSSSGGSGGTEGEPAKVNVEDCGGRLRSMASAPERLRDTDWMDRAPRSNELPAAYREFLVIEAKREREHIGGGPPPPP